MAEQPQVAYSVEVIHDCIVRDTPLYNKFRSQEKKRELYRKKKKLLEECQSVKSMIDSSFVRSFDSERGTFLEKVGWMPSELIIVDQRIREMCRNLFFYPDEYVKKTGVRFGPCPGFDKLSACPLFSPAPEETRAKLDAADIFIALQSRPFLKGPAVPGWQDVLIGKLKKEIERVNGKGSVTAAFGAGPCKVCYPQSCLGGGKCRVPKERLYALESAGIPVGQLCKDMAFFTGNDGWKIKWIKFTGTPRQTPKRWKTTGGLAVRLGIKGT
jgi:hypothetical protein